MLRRSILLVVSALALLALTVAGVGTGLLYLAPALVLALVLIAGRYPGEARLTALASRAVRAPRRAVSASAGRQLVERLLPRGGRLLATSLAVRPPPLQPTYR